MKTVDPFWTAEPYLLDEPILITEGSEETSPSPESEPQEAARNQDTEGRDYGSSAPNEREDDHDHDYDHGSYNPNDGTNNLAISVAASGDQFVDSGLVGTAWGDATVTYAFSASSAAYDYTGTGLEDLPANFLPVTALQIAASHFGLSTTEGVAASYGFSVEGFTNLDIDFLGTTDTGNPHMRIAQTSSTQVGTARVGDFPNSLITAERADDGDIWYGTTSTTRDYSIPEAGNLAWRGHLHEIGHALGLKHTHESSVYGITPAEFRSHEYSVMGASYAGGEAFYSNEEWGHPQSYMMGDIARLQYIYGADFTTNDGDTVYTWTPSSGETFIDGVAAITPGANRIFATLWDGDGNDTYDLSAYSNGVNIDLSPGGFSVFSAGQLADLGGGGNGGFARGNIFNALQYQGDARSLIENAIGGSGDDTLTGNAADNTLDGGLGSDTVSYDGFVAVTVDLAAGTASGTEIGSDTLISIENVIGSVYDDAITGNDDANILTGGFGDDTLIGGLGNDSLYGGLEDDLLQGGAGDDILYGESEEDTLEGGDGNDTLYGGIGIDILRGDAGDDILYGGSNITAGPTVQSGLSFGTGQYTRAANAGNDSIANAIDISGFFSLDDDPDIIDPTTTPHVSIMATGDAVTSVHYYAINLTLTGSVLTLDTDYGVNFGGSFDDWVELYDPNGNLVETGDIGAIADGAGGSTSIYDGFITHTVETPGIYHIAVGTYFNLSNVQAGDTYELQVSVEEILPTVESDTSSDTLYGGAGNDTLYGEDGNDFLRGDAGDDILNGGFGVDYLRGGAGADQLLGYAGADWADYITSSSAVTVNLLTNTGTGGDAQGDTYVLVERVYGSSHDDSLTGDNGVNYLRGYHGDDMLFGGVGGDYLQGDAGADAMDGGAGSDWAYYVSSAAGLTVDLGNTANNTGEAIGDTYISVENLFGSRFNDSLTGDAGSNVLRGFLGDDTLIGGAGDDFLRGDAGADVMDGGAGNDWLYYAASAGAVTVDLGAGTASGGDAAGDTFTNMERVYGSNLADTITGDGGINYLRGSGGSDTINGGAGTDFLQGDQGADTLDGGAGTDWAYYVSAKTGVTVDLSNSANNTGEATGDTFISIESVRGSNFDDILTGDAGTNYLIGGSGKDIITGGAGNDTMRGDAGADTFVFVIGTFRDTVIDYNDAENDMLDFSDFGFADVASVLAEAFETGNDVIFTIGVEVITIFNTTIAEISDNIII